MIQYITGNILDSDAQALVNTVNTIGVMGKGIALQFKKEYPHNYKAYEKACQNEEITAIIYVLHPKNTCSKSFFNQKTCVTLCFGCFFHKSHINGSIGCTKCWHNFKCGKHA